MKCYFRLLNLKHICRYEYNTSSKQKSKMIQLYFLVEPINSVLYIFNIFLPTKISTTISISIKERPIIDLFLVITPNKRHNVFRNTIMIQCFKIAIRNTLSNLTTIWKIEHIVLLLRWILVISIKDRLR